MWHIELDADDEKHLPLYCAQAPVAPAAQHTGAQELAKQTCQSSGSLTHPTPCRTFSSTTVQMLSLCSLLTKSALSRMMSGIVCAHGQAF